MVLLGKASGATTTVGPITWTGTFASFQFEYFIAGYNGGTPVGRFLVGDAAIATTSGCNGNRLAENYVVNATASTTVPGVPLAVTLSSISRAGYGWILGDSGQPKHIIIEGHEGNAAVGTAPTIFSARSFFSSGTNLPLKRAQLTVYDTNQASAVSAQTFTAGTFLRIWGLP
jgi:hypothetical protein